MPSKIRVLSDHTINKIAAGEVIENPASVVKELVENSLDAGATDICVEISGGGRQMIRISDNGYGMNSDDALLCLERHATSKIRDVEEIHSLTTMGFRGEAIPSIASISKFTILTCSAGENEATMVIVDGGKVISCKPAARAPGTTMEVKSLFFNVPVRKKFLKSPAVDANEILKTVSLIAIGNPKVKFQLINDGKNQLMAPSSQNETLAKALKVRIGDVLGHDFLQNTGYIEGENGNIKLQGVVGLPSYTRHNRTGQYLFINQRGVVSPLVAFAVRDGFGTSLVSGRHPVFVLHLTIPGDLVDVNVHPQKREVRLRQEQAIRELIIKSIEGFLRRDTSFINDSAQVPVVSPVFENHFHGNERDKSPFPNDEAWVFKPIPPGPTATALAQPIRPSVEVVRAGSIAIFDYEKTLKPTLPVQTTFTTTEKRVLAPRVIATLPRFILIDASQPNEFVLRGCPAATKGGLILIDQKSAHARIIFEKLLQREKGEGIAQQALLIPHPVEVPSFEAGLLRESLDLLSDMGISMKEFGVNTFLIDAIPQIFGNSNLEQLIGDIIHQLREGTGSKEQEKVKHIALAASKAAVSNGRRLELAEAQSLVDQLVKCDQPYRCPEGKVVMVQLTSDELGKLFQR